VGKLKVRVLPSLIFFKDGVAIGRQTGFEGLVRTMEDEDFPTARLLRAMRATGVLGAQPKDEGGDTDDEDIEDEASVRLNRARRAMLEAADDAVSGGAGTGV
jgi:hypothetical protein